MKIPDELFKKWVDLRSYGDGKKIAEAKELTEMEVSRAFNTQECSDETFKKLAEYFKQKEETIKEYL